MGGEQGVGQGFYVTAELDFVNSDLACGGGVHECVAVFARLVEEWRLMRKATLVAAGLCLFSPWNV